MDNGEWFRECAQHSRSNHIKASCTFINWPFRRRNLREEALIPQQPLEGRQCSMGKERDSCRHGAWALLFACHDGPQVGAT